MPNRRPRSVRPLSALALALLLGGCKDAPTLPHALQRLAGGEEWAAMTVPEGLPDLSTWLPYLKGTEPATQSARTRIRELTSQARLARATDPVRASTLQREAERIAVISLTRTPPPQLFRAAMSAVDVWQVRVRQQVDLVRAPELGRSLARVEASHTAAAAALTAGDTTSAILHLASAAERIRGHTPEAVALRVLAAVEVRLTAQATRDADGVRALHLLRSARQELLDGNPELALQRALYALQIADGGTIPTGPAAEGRPCQGPPC